MNKTLPIGGEFWLDYNLQDTSVYNELDNEGILLSGGKNAIEFILKAIDFKKGEILALPSYLCPTIVECVKNLDIEYEFYAIDSKLEIDLDSINSLIKKSNIKAIFFINYFGFYHKNDTLEFLKSLKKKNIVLIEDAVQIFWIKRQEKFIGDYIFNSYRKFLPIDGSLILCNKTKTFSDIEDDYFKIIEKAREEKTNFILNGKGNESDILKLFDKAHKEYYKRKGVFGINLKYKEFLNKIPLENLLNKRKDNYRYLFNCLKEIEGIQYIKDIKEDLCYNTPLSFPILLLNRDYVKIELMKKNIYAPVHWDLKNESWTNDFKETIEVSNSILSLPIDWRYGIKEMNYLARSLKVILKKQEVKIH